MTEQKKIVVVLGDDSRLAAYTSASLATDMNVVRIVYGADGQRGDTVSETYYAHMPRDLDSIAKAVLERHGRIDGYVHFAARSFDDEAAFPYLSSDTWQKSKQMGVDLFYHGARCFVKPMASAGGMRVLVIGAAAGVVPARGQRMAAPMSAAAFMLVQSLAIDAAQQGIIANALALSAFDPAFGTDWTNADEHLIAHIPMKRRCGKEEMMNMVRFLLKDAPDYFTGNVLTLDGGLSSAYMRDW